MGLLIEKYLNEQIGAGMHRRGLKSTNILGELKRLTSKLFLAVSRQDERAFNITLNNLLMLLNELKKSNLFGENK
jgi:hypothetical protein